MLGSTIAIDQLKSDYDAVFIGIGLGDVNALGLPGSDLPGVEDAVSFIARLRQSSDLTQIQSQVGRHVVVVGGGMTAIDAAVQAKLLGAENVTVVYRRSQTQMNASTYEQELAQTHGVLLRTNLQPIEIVGDDTGLQNIIFEYTHSADGKLEATGEQLQLKCDQVFVAIGQKYSSPFGESAGVSLTMSAGRIDVDDQRRSSDSSIWAGGDCIAGGDDLTVSAVQDGKVAAESIHDSLEKAHG